MLSAAEIAAMRSVQNEALPGTAVISRYGIDRGYGEDGYGAGVYGDGDDGMGGIIETWGTIGTVDCRLASQEFQPREDDVASQLQDVDLWIVTLPYNTDVQARDRIVTDGRTFEVNSVLAHGDWETARRVWCAEVGS